ncbi:hypothetical protein S40293_03148 [Stachybotrys chartarum IBT 40293]|nr:hypothetical protein S40293_03148 [Stachybotrys chartarum IBT 40293]
MSGAPTVAALSAAFTFGILLNAASGAAFIWIKTHGSAILRDGSRLVLAIFLIAATLWAQVAFAATLVEPFANLSCQVAIAIASSFDQIARIALEQFLVWSLQRDAKLSPAAILFQIGIVGRFGLAVGFVAVQRPQFVPVCLTSTSSLPLGLAIIIFDGVFVAGLFIWALVNGLREEGPNAKALFSTIAGLGIWTATSAPMILGIQSIDMIARTVIPAIGILLAFHDKLTISRVTLLQSSAERAGPNDSEASRAIPSRDLHNRADSNATSYYAPSRYEDLKAEAAATAYPVNTANGMLPSITGPVPGQAMAGVGGLPVTGQLFPPIREQQAPALRQAPRSANQIPVKNLRNKQGKLLISEPILNNSSAQNPLNKIPTVDLATAAKNDKERRAVLPNPLAANLLGSRPAPQPPVMSAEQMAQRYQNVQRRDVGGGAATKTVLTPIPEPTPVGSSSSAQFSPGIEEVRRRSPRQPSAGFAGGNLAPRTLGFPQLNIPATNAPVGLTIFPPPRSPLRPSSSLSPVALNLSKTIRSDGSKQAKPVTPTPGKEMITTSLKSPTQPPAQPTVGQPVAARARHTSADKSRETLLLRSGSVNQTIRPSRQASQTSSNGPPVPAKTPTQSRPAVGLPSNPKIQALRLLEKENGIPRQQTVMLVSNIEYNDPMAVQSIVSGALEKPSGLAIPPAPITAPLLHRPRPIPRQPSVDRPIFPSELSPRVWANNAAQLPHHPQRPYHGRSLSAGSVLSKKSILNSTAGSPTQLPPLPPLPMTMGNPSRPQPNNTKSMTFDEKMELLYQGNPTSAASTPKNSRPSTISRPEVPRIPSFYQNPQSSVLSPEPAGSSIKIVGDKPGSSSIPLASAVNVAGALPPQPDMPLMSSKFSQTTYQSPREESKSWLALDMVQNRPSFEGTRRQSSPLLPLDYYRSSSILSNGKTREDDDATTHWGSLHSPAEPINVQKAKEIAIPALTQPAVTSPELPVASVQAPSSPAMSEDGTEVFTVMLDSSTEYATTPRESSLLNVHNMGGGIVASGWHRRVGDDCPAFSTRKNAMGSRKMPPPTPLALHRPKVPMVIEAEPSPLESPEHALAMIQAQLQSLDEPNNRESASSQQQQRMTLLANLELEMGMQEDQWQQLRTNIGRDSTSTLSSIPSRDRGSGLVATVPDVAEEPLLKNMMQRRRSSRRSRMKAQGKSPAPQRRRQEEGDLYMEQLEMQALVSAKSGTRMSYLVVQPTSHGPWGSPTPPESEESESESEALPIEIDRRTTQPAAASLWRPAPMLEKSTSVSVSALWMPANLATDLFSHIDTPPQSRGKSLPKTALEPLVIESSQLWRSPARSKAAASAANGLWKAAWTPRVTASPQKPKQVKSVQRPLTQRPPRRSKRITMLPDILESPTPLPDKRGTLGIFQFPWGELSDVPTVQARLPTFGAMPGTMTTGRSSMLPSMGPIIPVDPVALAAEQFDQSNYSTSYFDDYEEEDDGDNFSDWEMQASDDGRDEDDFDETTLWEIASLLKADNIPSRESLFPGFDSDNDRVSVLSAASSMPRADSLIEPDVSETLWEEEDGEVPKHDSIPMVLDLESFPSPPRAIPLLWEDASPAQAGSIGLPQPATSEWEAYCDMEKIPRVPTARPSQESTITSRSMWSLISNPARVDGPGLLWTSGKVASQPDATLWLQPPPVSVPALGLSQSDGWTAYANLPQQPRAVRVKSENASPFVVESTTLWSTSDRSGITRHNDWLRASAEKPSARPQSAPTLWAPSVSSAAKSSYGLPQVDTEAWEAYLTSVPSINRSRLYSEDPAVIQTSELWSAQKEAKMRTKATSLWAGQSDLIADEPEVSVEAISQQPPTNAEIVSSLGMWVSSLVDEEEKSEGLFDAGHKRSVFRTTRQEPAALELRRKHRSDYPVTLPELESSTLWTVKSENQVSRSWLDMPTHVEVPHTNPSTQLEIAEATSEEIIRGPVQRPYRPIFEYPGDWDAALREATNTSYQSDIMVVWNVRLAAATSGQWDAALQEAIRAGQPARPAAAESDWAHALAEAIQASRVDADESVPSIHDDSSERGSDWDQVSQNDSADSLSTANDEDSSVYSTDLSEQGGTANNKLYLWASTSAKPQKPKSNLWQRPIPAEHDQAQRMGLEEAARSPRIPSVGRKVGRVLDSHLLFLEYSRQGLWNSEHDGAQGAGEQHIDWLLRVQASL